MSIGLASAPGVTVSDYETALPKPVGNNSGPKCHKCSRPYRQCSCQPSVDVPGENAAMETPPARQASSLEMIAFHAGKLVDRLDKILARLDQISAAKTPSVSEVDIMPTGILIPGITDPAVPPVLDAATLAANEAKKSDVLNRTKNLK